VNSKQDAVFRTAQEFDPSGKFQQRSKWAALVLEHLGKDEMPEGGIFALHGRTIGFLWATNQRVLYVGRAEGIFSKREVLIEHLYDRIGSIEISTKHSALDSIRIKTGADTTEYKIMPTSARGDEFVALVREKLPPSAKDQMQTLSNDLVSQLERLSRLRDQGKLTEAEYAAAKAKILNL
jgi:hypothetical protein